MIHYPVFLEYLEERECLAGKVDFLRNENSLDRCDFCLIMKLSESGSCSLVSHPWLLLIPCLAGWLFCLLYCLTEEEMHNCKSQQMKYCKVVKNGGSNADYVCAKKSSCKISNRSLFITAWQNCSSCISRCYFGIVPFPGISQEEQRLSASGSLCLN